jgi:hypothetical protein
VKARTLTGIGLVLLLSTGVLAALATSKNTEVTTETITTNGRTITVTKVEKQNVPGPGLTITRTLPGGRLGTVQLPGRTTTVNGSTHVITRTVRSPTSVITAPAHTITSTRTVTHTQTQTVSHTTVVTVITPVAGPTVTVVETVTVKGNGNCPPQNPHCP